MKYKFFGHWRVDFVTGLAILLPAVISIAVLIWLFGTVSNFTDTLLVFIPRRFTHHADGAGPPFWYASLGAFALALLFTCFVGMLTRYYLGKKIISWVDSALLQVPLLNKIYGAIKQIKDAVGSSNKTSFRTTVLVEFPRKGIYSLGFITSEQRQEIQRRTPEHVVTVFVPTTPNPTSGFLVMVPEQDVIKLDMSVADGIKYIISLGSIAPEFKRATDQLENAEPAEKNG